MKKFYLIKREDFFKPDNGLPKDVYVFRSGIIWTEVLLSEEEKNKYKYSIVSQIKKI